jgi:hypothetical protein
VFEIHPEAEEDWMRIVVALGFTLVSLAVMAAGVTLWQEGEADIVGRAGDLVIVPLKEVHTAMTGAEPTTLVVFRVHEQGQPERTLVDEGHSGKEIVT